MEVAFYVTTSYAFLSLFAYAVVCFIICKHKKIFSGSYHNIFLVNAAVNCYTYLNSLITLRLPNITCNTCSFAFLFTPQHFWGLEFLHCMYGHLAYVQYLMILSLAFNRFTAVVFPLQYEKVWSLLFIPLMVFNIIVPFASTYPYLLANSTFLYSETLASYTLVASLSSDVMQLGQSLLVSSMVLISVVSTVIMAATFIAYLSYKREDRSAQWKLLAYSIINFLILVFATMDVILMSFRQVGNVAIILLPYVSDALTFTSPYVLVYCSPLLQKLLKQLVLKQILRQKNVTLF